jgi:hypothetical protein
LIKTFFFSFKGEITIKANHVSENGDDYVDLTMDAVSLMNKTKSSSSNRTIEPFELEYISMEEIIRVCYSFFCFFL